MSKITEEEVQKILPTKGPSFKEVKNYLEKYNNEYIVIKCGGSVLVNQDLFNNFINDISILNKLGFIPIIIHGGGKRISNKLNEFGIKSEFINGLRVTDEKSINVVEEVLNNFNTEIIEALKKNSCDSQGITNKQSNILLVEQEDKKLGARRLIIMSDVEGVLDNNKKLIPEIDTNKINELIKNKTISGGMIPKIKNCLDVASNGVKGVCIIDGRLDHSILFELLSDKGSGTLIRA